ncbi:MULTISPECIES: DUF1501 domain-containing protein [Pectobacterium]|uniref:DUF1501 domain-containing protein n=1 Tax=Pectobacterium carotovorum subsp. carotovorum (strain PC1) TaxID=561230 RepID=C6DJ06_PECCP|nr:MULTISPECIES: DUF1501 domain-containing protein [Pectobacterium]ACT13276.1 protein of unknown function DUF1501 [Pectobacterium carotovorum subsp. carotovorum PC1]MBG0749659.1 hypothetical protein [Pectobacterium carotovorum subsp. carotovorum PCCS1]UUE34536.1 DUF1501 domain-containing protein [Pectobacterium aroidearum]UUE38914.1 DUF1501 domain-containing protein [Pectobacterium aroidearum]UUE46905.1 DUF1501 domain-containing protein [Pectobacterium aroidearum]
MSAPFIPSRRLLLGGLAAGILTTMLPLRGFAKSTIPINKHLIVIELFGGNDALNTLVPYRDPLYRHYRPMLALKAHEYAPLNDDLAFNLAWKKLAHVFQKGELAVIQDVGYPSPNLSHFSSAAIWANGADTPTLKSGWAGRVLSTSSREERYHDTDGIILSGDQSLLIHPTIQALTLQDSRALLSTDLTLASSQTNDNRPPAAQHILRLMESTSTISRRIQNKLRNQNHFTRRFTHDGYIEPQNAQAATILWLIENNVRSPLYKISLSGFDLHSHLRGEHERQLSKVETLMLGLRQGLIDIGAWQDSLIMVHSEFGRRPKENASGGTDHGTCGPMLLLGGQVEGGIWGARSPLDKLDSDGNPYFSTDFRSIYAAVAERFWKLPVTQAGGTPLSPLNIRL